MSATNKQLIESDNSRYIKLIDENMSVKPFGGNSVSDRAFKKTERLILATYLITNHISSLDELSIDLRNTSRGLLPLVSSSQNLFKSVENTAPLLLEIRKLLILIDLLFASHMVSEINMGVLKRAYIDFAEFIRSSVGSEKATNLNLNGIFNESINRSTADNVAAQNSSPKQVGRARLLAKKEDRVALASAKNNNKNTSIKSRAVSTNRRVVILDMVSKTGSVTVKDISKQIPDTSPKTLQRELMKLVEDGVLKKEGNKRWTVYSLVLD